MEYSELLKNQTECPFCILKKEEIIKKNWAGKVILARAPYEDGHLLVISNRHVSNLSDLKRWEKFGLFKLILWAEEKMKNLHESYSILYREGEKQKVGKSIEHLHVHLIPNIRIISSKNYKDYRKAYDDTKYVEETRAVRQELLCNDKSKLKICDKSDK